MAREQTKLGDDRSAYRKAGPPGAEGDKKGDVGIGEGAEMGFVSINISFFSYVSQFIFYWPCDRIQDCLPVSAAARLGGRLTIVP